jgi:NAD(P)H dehydrogenase (quinone)
MQDVKLAVIYYSSTGANHQMAQWAAEAGREAGAEVRLVKIRETAPQEAIESNPAWKSNEISTRHIPEATLDDLEWADAVIFSVPTRYGSIASQMRAFFDTTGGLWFHGKLANKVVSAMSSAQNPHGGQESTILSLYTTMFHWGAIVAAPGYTAPELFKAGGNPYGVSATVDPNGVIKDDVKDAVFYQAQRTLHVAGWVKAGMAVEV